MTVDVGEIKSSSASFSKGKAQLLSRLKLSAWFLQHMHSDISKFDMVGHLYLPRGSTKIVLPQSLIESDGPANYFIKIHYV